MPFPVLEGEHLHKLRHEICGILDDIRHMVAVAAGPSLAVPVAVSIGPESQPGLVKRAIVATTKRTELSPGRL